jgi:glycosyltransferase involved in cell wall biosynthesis
LGAWAEQAGIPASRVSVIENALDLNRLTRTPGADVRRQFAIPDRVPLGIMVAGLRPSKGLDVLLEAVRRLVPRCSLSILVAGGIRDPGYVDVCRRSIERLGLQEHVRLLGERTDVVSLLQNVDFAVHPARSESGPLVLIEYAVSGVPLAASFTGAVARRLEVRGVPEFVPPGDAAALAAALERLLSLCPSAREQRCAVGRETALREFDIRNVMPRWYELYGRLVERTDAGRPIGEWTC